MTIKNDCPSGKVTFTTKSSAEDAAKKVVKGGRKLRVYRCPVCGLWHLTSSYSRENQKLYTSAHKFSRVDTDRNWKKFAAEFDYRHQEISGKDCRITTALFCE